MRPRWVMTPEEVAILDANAEALGANMDELMITSAEHLANALEGASKPIWILVDLEIMEAMVFVLHKC